MRAVAAPAVVKPGAAGPQKPVADSERAAQRLAEPVEHRRGEIIG